MKKAQAAMEFLMTYGWAILVVLGAVAALSYFGVLSPDKFLPNKCSLPSGFGCVDFTASDATDSIILVLQNGAGYQADLTSFSIAGCTDPTPTYELNSLGSGVSLSGSNSWLNGEKIFVTFDCTEDLVNKAKFNGDVTFAYTTVNGLPKTAVGDLVVKVEP